MIKIGQRVQVKHAETPDQWVSGTYLGPGRIATDWHRVRTEDGMVGLFPPDFVREPLEPS